MNPKKLGGMANHQQEPWKVPLPQYIEESYLKHFRKERPDNVRSIEQMVADRARKQAQQKKHRHQQEAAAHPGSPIQPPPPTNPQEAIDDNIPF